MRWITPLLVIAAAGQVVIAASGQVVFPAPLHADAGRSCLASEALIQLDAGWENALLEGDADFLQHLLADEFIWVHNHAAQIDSREDVIEAFSRRSDGSGMRSRVSSDVEVRRLGATAVVTGYTVVERQQSSTRYRFMRTYVEVSGSCFLLANQTMAIPEGE